MSDNMDKVEENVKINESLLENRAEEKIVSGQSGEKDESHVVDSKQIKKNDNQNFENINISIEKINEKTVENVPNMKNTSEVELQESIRPASVCDGEGVDITEKVDIGSGKQEQCNTKSNKLTDQIPEGTSKTEAEIEISAEKKMDTEIKVLESNISNNDTTGELMEVDTHSLDYLGGNDDSQESLPLVIDEKPASPKEGNENDEPSTSISENSLTTNSITEEGLIENSSCGVKTQIDHNKKDIDKVTGETKDRSGPENIIEIDDENEETKPEEDPDVEITATRSPSYIPIIEIDDDDDEDELNKDNKIAQISEKKDESVVSAADNEDAEIFNDNRKNTINDDNKEVKEIEDITMRDSSETNEVAEQPDLLKLTALQPEPQEESNCEQTNCEDTVDEVFYKQECVNHDCPHNHKQFFLAPPFALSHFKVKKRRTQKQFICSECFDCALDAYEEYCGLLKAKQPLLLKNITVQGPEFVEITDSSDDDEETSKTQQIQTDKAKGSFSKVSLDLVEAELENSIKNVLEKLDIQSQLTWSKTILETRARRLEVESDLNDKLLRTLQKKADQMYSSLYQCPKIRLRQFQPLDLNTNLPYNFPEVTPCPPVGEIMRLPIEINQVYYAVKNKAIASWVPCRVVEQMDTSSILGAHNRVPIYKVKFLKLQYQMVKTVSAKHLAYFDPPKFRLPIGSRVIAYFDATSLSRGKEKMMIQSAFYPGIIAEPLKPNNKYRYLIFYDDGYTQYVSHKDVRLVCNVSEHVWEDVHPASREFIQKYLTQYSINRPMVQTQKGQSMTTESNGKWIYARVVDIDCSLIQMQFEGPKSHTEWIYRGSLRLGPVFKEYQKTLQKDTLPIPRLARRTEPFIRYTADEEATTAQQEQVKEREREQRVTSNEPRAVAKKSVSRLSTDSTATLSTIPSPTTSLPTVRHLNNSTIYLEDENKPKGKVVYYTAKRDLPPLIYRPHKCSPTCLFKIPHNLSAYSPLSKPLLSGWERPILRLKSKKIVAYRGPCGKIMRNMEEVRRYLRATENTLNVDNFDFHHETSCLAEYVIESAIVQKRDISGGQEKMAIPLVNYYDNTLPPECKYAAQRIPTDGVNLNLDSEFLVGCDCEGDCSDKAKCSCWQLTYAGAKYGNPNTPMEEIGYQYKRLYEHVPTGIYECNSRCKCKSNCLNRVAQQPLAMKLQVFKTSNRGWGLRCINDVPRGSFVCIYAGHLLTEAKANEGGLDAGDEYFAELDYIEVAEQIKEGYESDVEPPEVEEEEDAYAPDPEDDDEFTPSKSFLTRAKNKAQKLTRSSSAQNTDEDSQERQVINFNPNADMNEDSARESSIRALFGKDEACYVMDAKITGNLGRYFNHSCSPNLFVQNVFVDTHDLRFPWVAFFSSTNIRAGTELTWNYNYEVGVVPGKVLYCQCGAPNCRLRLL